METKCSVCMIRCYNPHRLECQHQICSECFFSIVEVYPKRESVGKCTICKKCWTVSCATPVASTPAVSELSATFILDDQSPRRTGATSPRYSALSPSYAPVSPGYNQTSPSYSAYRDGSASRYSAASPSYAPVSPRYSAASPSYAPVSPRYSAASPSYAPVSPRYSAASPSYAPVSPRYSAASPSYAPVSPRYSAASPSYGPDSPRNSAASPTYEPTSPSYSVDSPRYTRSSQSHGLSSPYHEPHSSGHSSASSGGSAHPGSSISDTGSPSHSEMLDYSSEGSSLQSTKDSGHGADSPSPAVGEPCDLCGNSGPLHQYCFACCKSFCKRCSTEHSEKKPFSLHEAVPIENVSMCGAHRKELLSIWCVNCAEQICQKCVFQEHLRHDTKDLDSMVQKKIESLEKYIQDVENISPQAVDFLKVLKNDIDKNKIKLQQFAKTMKFTLETAMDNLNKLEGKHADLATTCESKIREVENLLEEKNQAVVEKRNEVSSLKNKNNSAIQKCLENMTSTTLPAEQEIPQKVTFLRPGLKGNLDKLLTETKTLMRKIPSLSVSDTYVIELQRQNVHIKAEQDGNKPSKARGSPLPKTAITKIEWDSGVKQDWNKPSTSTRARRSAPTKTSTRRITKVKYDSESEEDGDKPSIYSRAARFSNLFKDSLKVELNSPQKRRRVTDEVKWESWN